MIKTWSKTGADFDLNLDQLLIRYLRRCGSKIDPKLERILIQILSKIGSDFGLNLDQILIRYCIKFRMQVDPTLEQNLTKFKATSDQILFNFWPKFDQIPDKFWMKSWSKTGADLDPNLDQNRIRLLFKFGLKFD